MKKFLLLSGSIIGSCIASTAMAASLDVDLNNDTLSGQYHFSDQYAELGISAGAMLTDDRGELLHLTLRTQGQLANEQAVRGGFGVRAYLASPNDGDGYQADNYQALALGGFVEVTVPKVPDLSFALEVYYAPSITLTDDIDNQREINFRASYQLFKNAAVYAGIRHLEVEQNDFDYEFDEGLHAGFSLQF